MLRSKREVYKPVLACCRTDLNCTNKSCDNTEHVSRGWDQLCQCAKGADHNYGVEAGTDQPACDCWSRCFRLERLLQCKLPEVAPHLRHQSTWHFLQVYAVRCLALMLLLQKIQLAMSTAYGRQKLLVAAMFAASACQQWLE